MKKKVIMLFLFLFIVGLLLLFYLPVAGVVCFFLMFMCLSLGIMFLLLNEAYKHTNNWKNRFVFTKKFVTGKGYRIDYARNYDIVNLGSNPAYYGFFYENLRGQNWSTGSQGFDMDFEILKLYHSYLKEHGVVIIPLMPFSAISPYLKNKKEYWNDNYYLRFVRILDGIQIKKINNWEKLLKQIKYPLLYNPKLLKYLVVDDIYDNTYNIPNQTMSKLELEFDASNRIKSWLKEFDASNMNDFLEDKYEVYLTEARNIVDSIIDFCVQRDYRPVLVSVPMSKELYSYFDENFYKKMIEGFVDGLTNNNTVFLDCMKNVDFHDSSLYNGSLYMNCEGRKKFTKYVIERLEIIDIIN